MDEVRKAMKINYFDDVELIAEQAKRFEMCIRDRHTDAQLRAYNERKKFTFPLYPDPKREVLSLIHI